MLLPILLLSEGGITEAGIYVCLYLLLAVLLFDLVDLSCYLLLSVLRCTFKLQKLSLKYTLSQHQPHIRNS